MALVQNHYELNVSKDGQHYFATAERSAVDWGAARALWKDLKKRFPESEGFRVEVTKVSCYGTEMVWEEGDLG